MADLNIEEFGKSTRERVQSVAEELDTAEREMSRPKTQTKRKPESAKVVRMKERGGGASKKPTPDPASDEPLTRKTTVKFSAVRFQRLQRAAHLQAIKNKKPDTIQGIINEAFDAWWKESGYE